MKLGKSLILFSCLLLTFNPTDILAGGGGLNANEGVAVHYGKTDEGKEKVGKKIRLEVAYVSELSEKTEFGQAILAAHTMFNDEDGGYALIVAPAEMAEELKAKYGAADVDKKKYRTKSLSGKFAGIEKNIPVVVIEGKTAKEP